eukprot:TRINITY_DN2567_c0_g1_i1.p1 TRINITY_DN2567_c0_g1~~TRINITY_DN2567_c0_g1_i1.p1  ORF type:complete len:424 (-),score=108.64 TRINITY_DN2567_c0_g1_i1:318-1589(-)
MTTPQREEGMEDPSSEITLKGNLKKVTKACSICKRDHASCDKERPCKRCVSRGTSEECTDAESKKRGRKRNESSSHKAPASKLHSSSSSSSSIQYNEDNTVYNNNNNNNEQSVSSIQNNENLSENFMEMWNGGNEDKGSSNFLWLMDQMMPNYLQNSFSPDSSEDPFAFLNSPSLTQTVVEEDHTIPKTPQLLSYDPEFEKEQPPSLFIRSNETVFTLARIMVAKGIISQSEIYEHFEKMKESAQKIQEIRKFITPEQKIMMKQEFDFSLLEFKTGAEKIGVPCLLWERSGIVHHVNQAFIDMTGFSMNLPSSVNEFALLKIFSSTSLSHYSKFIRENYFSTGITRKILAAGIKIWNSPNGVPRVESQTKESEGSVPSITDFCEGPYIEGTICITIKRDILGLPMIMCGHFLPSPTALPHLSL